MDEAQECTEKARMIEDIGRARKLGGPGWLHAFREESARRFGEAELPNRKQEAWRFTNLNPLVRTPFESVVAPAAADPGMDAVGPLLVGEAWPRLVFVNGFYSPGLSAPPEGTMFAGGWDQAMNGREDLVRGSLGRCLNGSSPVWALLNGAFARDGAVVSVPKGHAEDTPLHIVYLTTGIGRPSAAHPRNLVVLEPLAELTLVETWARLDGASEHFNNVVTEVQLGEGARLRRVKILNEGDVGFHLSSTSVRQSRDSRLETHTFLMGGRIGREEITSVLAGEGASCSLNGLYLTRDGELVDNCASVRHEAPHCSSWIGYKGVLDGKSSAVFSGRVHVARGAQKTDSNQLNNNLLLTDKATVDTKPLLEIYADDVKCTHGATVGPPPPEQVFYLRTRGVGEARALAMLTEGFAGEIIGGVPVPELRDALTSAVSSRFRSR